MRLLLLLVLTLLLLLLLLLLMMLMLWLLPVLLLLLLLLLLLGWHWRWWLEGHGALALGGWWHRGDWWRRGPRWYIAGPCGNRRCRRQWRRRRRWVWISTLWQLSLPSPCSSHRCSFASLGLAFLAHWGHWHSHWRHGWRGQFWCTNLLHLRFKHVHTLFDLVALHLQRCQ
jgi:hypothetical protein